MSRAGLLTALAVVAVAVLSIGLYAMKFEVAHLDSRAAELDRLLLRQNEALQVLQSEWSYLNRPERLRDLANRHLNLVPVAVHQIGALEEIPIRAASAVAVIRDPLPRIQPGTPPSAQIAEAGKRENP